MQVSIFVIVTKLACQLLMGHVEMLFNIDSYKGLISCNI